MTEYTKARQAFLNEIKRVFPNSKNISIDVDVDGISEADFVKLPVPHKEQYLMGGAFKCLTSTFGAGDSIDTFNSEYL